jgi:diguanylate cyclase (GGDEF)-like protein
MFDDKSDETFEKYYNYSIDFSSITSTQIYQEKSSNRLLTYIAIDDYQMEQAISDSVGEEIKVYSDNGSLFVFGEVIISDTSLYQTIKTSYIIITVFYIIVSFIITRLIDEVFYNRQKQLKSLKFSSEHDSLTGLANRKKVFQTIENLNKNQEHFAILFLDLDKFKEVNDSFGHHIGDTLLIEVSNRLKQLLRSSDTIARLGGDEFLIILRDMNKQQSATKLQKKIKEAIVEPYQIEQYLIQIGVSIGISIQDGTKQIDDLINEADKNMYKDKHTNI